LGYITDLAPAKDIETCVAGISKIGAYSPDNV
jgi:hypothetical protein